MSLRYVILVNLAALGNRAECFVTSDDLPGRDADLGSNSDSPLWRHEDALRMTLRRRSCSPGAIPDGNKLVQ